MQKSQPSLSSASCWAYFRPSSFSAFLYPLTCFPYFPLSSVYPASPFARGSLLPLPLPLPLPLSSLFSGYYISPSPCPSLSSLSPTLKFLKYAKITTLSLFCVVLGILSPLFLLCLSLSPYLFPLFSPFFCLSCLSLRKRKSSSSSPSPSSSSFFPLFRLLYFPFPLSLPFFPLSNSQVSKICKNHNPLSLLRRVGHTFAPLPSLPFFIPLLVSSIFPFLLFILPLPSQEEVFFLFPFPFLFLFLPSFQVIIFPLPPVPPFLPSLQLSSF